MHPESAWIAMENALATAQSLSNVLNVRRADEHAGSHPRSAFHLLGKKQAMYRERRKMAFDGVKTWSIVADPATHSKREVLGTLIYSWEIGIATHGDLQYLPMSKRLLSSEIDSQEHLKRDAMMGEVPVLPASALASAQSHPLLVLSLDPRQCVCYVYM